jgi:flagellin-specific chaperone FliS
VALRLRDARPDGPRMKMALTKSTPEQEVAYKDLHALLKKNVGGATAVQLLAIAANMIGKLIAMQDQRDISREDAMEIVMTNIEHGQKQALDKLMGESKGNA